MDVCGAAASVSTLLKIINVIGTAESRLTLVLGHTLHTVVGRLDRVGFAVNPVAALVLVEHLTSKTTGYQRW